MWAVGWEHSAFQVSWESRWLLVIQGDRPQGSYGVKSAGDRDKLGLPSLQQGFIWVKVLHFG